MLDRKFFERELSVGGARYTYTVFPPRLKIRRLQGWEGCRFR